MKINNKILITIFIILMLFLVSCGKNAENINNNKNNNIEEKDDIDNNDEKLEEKDNKENINNEKESSKDDSKIETDKDNDNKKKNTDDFLIEKNIGEYDFKDSKFNSIKLNGIKFNEYSAYYTYGKKKQTKSEIIIYNLNEKGSLVEIFENLIKNNDYEFLEKDDYDFLKNDIYYNPYENTYIWMSHKNIILIKKSIGYDLLEKYMKKYETSIVSGSFENGDKIEIKFEKEKEEKVVTINNIQYNIVYDNFDKDYISLTINKEEIEAKRDTKYLAGGLLFEINEIDGDDFTLKIEKAITDIVKLEIKFNSKEKIKLGKEEIEIEFMGANDKEDSIVLSVNGNRKTFVKEKIKSVSGVSVYLEDILINTIGEESVKAYIKVFK